MEEPPEQHPPRSGERAGDRLEQLRSHFASFDDAVERRVKPVRGNPVADRVFYTASELGDFGLLWVIYACLRALRGRPLDERAAVRAIVATGVESVLVNVVLKSFFGRVRPVEQIDHPLPLRQPLSSSFPSGHATAAFCAATLLGERDPAWPVYALSAVLVATSRVYVRIHHASDVVAGVVVGLALGQIGRAIAPLEGRRRGAGGGRRGEGATRRRARWAAMTPPPVAPRVAVAMGSVSDEPVMRPAAEVLEEHGIPVELRVVSAHRTPLHLVDFGRSARSRGLQVIIAGAGGAAHLPGMLAALTTLPVIGVPIALSRLEGLDSLLSIVQMPRGVPVASVAIDNARNAGLLALRILALADPALVERLAEEQQAVADEVLARDAALDAQWREQAGRSR